MHLKNLKIQNFRNYSDLNLQFENGCGLALLGPNAQGKTNLIEAIAFLALGKSFRSSKTVEALAWNAEHGRIIGEVDKNGMQVDLQVFMQRDPELRKLKKQDKVVAPKDFLGTLRIVLFTPDDLQILSGSPKLRRQFMDRVLVQVDKNYVETLSAYQNLLKQRNSLLKRISMNFAKESELEVWDARFIIEAQKLWSARKELILFLTKELSEIYSSISKKDDKLEILYKTKSDQFEELLIASRDTDLRNGSTSVGPHRDDFTVLLNGNYLGEFGSRGECRTGILALKISQIHYIEKTCGEKPLLLLDDVFSELDETRQAHLGELLQNYQSIISTTAPEHIKGLKNAKVFLVNDGVLTEFPLQTDYKTQE